MWDRHCKPSSCHLSCHQMHFRCAPRTTPLIHSAKSCSQGFLCDIHHIKVTRRTKSNLCGPWHEGKREEFVSDSLSCCLPTPHVSNIPGWALGPQGCSSAPAPAVPSCLPASAAPVPGQFVDGGTDFCCTTQMCSGFVQQMLPGTGWQNFG